MEIGITISLILKRGFKAKRHPRKGAFLLGELSFKSWLYDL